MASLYEMAQGPDFDPVESFYAGRNLRIQDKFNQNKLAELARADQARPLIGNALMGDKNSLQSLAGIDPGAMMDVQKHQSDVGTSNLKVQQAEYERMHGVLSGADTPEKWNRAIQFLESQGVDVSPEERDFNNKDFVLAQGAKEAADLGLQPVWATDANGNPALFQLNKGGSKPSQVQFPPGVVPNPGVQFLNTGTEYVPANKRTGQVMPGTPSVAIDVAGKQSAEEIGKTQGAAQAALPGARSAAQTVTTQIDDVLNDPDLASITGYKKYVPEALASNAMIKIRSKLQRLGGQAFLEARTVLKGGGAISDTESLKAEQAFSRIEAAVASSDVNELKDALTEFKTAVSDGLAKLEAAANQKSPAANQGGGDYNLGHVFDDESGIPEGATVVDEESGQAMRKVNGKLVPVQ